MVGICYFCVYRYTNKRYIFKIQFDKFRHIDTSVKPPLLLKLWTHPSLAETSLWPFVISPFCPSRSTTLLPENHLSVFCNYRLFCMFYNFIWKFFLLSVTIGKTAVSIFLDINNMYYFVWLHLCRIIILRSTHVFMH